MFRKNNSRQNNRNSARKPNPSGQRESAGQPKSVSPNYRVDLMAHTFTQQTGGNTPGFGNHQRPQQPHHQKPRPQQHQQHRGQQHHQPRPQQQQQHLGQNPARKGYVNIAVEMPDELLTSFKEKNAADGKTGPEVIIQLISLYNAGKVTL